jgi:hypothetical protein
VLPLVIAAMFTLVPEAGATIQGVVRAEGTLEPIPFASVTIRALERAVQTDAHGFFVLSGVPAGRWRIESSALAYESNALTVVTADNGTVRLDFELQLRPVQLPGVLVRTEDRAAELVAPPDPGPGAVRMSALALKTIPGIAEPDILRGLQMLPSVSAISDYSTALYVRGGAADQNLLQLDGIPLFNPYHVAGLFGAVPADAISTVDVSAGALPARVGDRLSSAVVINTREGGKERLRTSGGIGLISTNFTVDGPVRGGRGSFLLSGRRTYIDAITGVGYGLGLIDFTVPYGFTDVYGKVTHRIGELGSIALSGYWDGERIYTPERMRDEYDDFGEISWGSRLTSLSYRQPIGGSLLLEARAGYTDFTGRADGWGVRPSDDSYQNPQAGADTFRLVLAHATTRDIVAGADLTWFRKRHTLRGGVRVDRYLFDHALTVLEDGISDHVPLFAKRSSLTNTAVYLEDEWQPGDRFSMRVGVRLLDGGRLGTALLPRLGARLQATPSLAFTAGGGRYAQSLRSMKDDESVIASFISYDLLTAQPDEAGLARGTDIVVGGEYTDRTTRVRAEAYLKQQDALVLAAETYDPIDVLDAPLLFIIDEYRIGTGSARGLELSAHRIAGRFDIGLSYALAQAERRAGSDTFAPRFDRRHRLDLSSDYRWGETGLLNARLVLASGQPFTPVLGLAQRSSYDPAQQHWFGGGQFLVPGAHNSARLPRYIRLDIAARRSYQRRWFGRDGTITPYLQIVNLLNHRNALIADPQPYPPHIEYWPQLPLLPTFGVEWRF